MSMCILRLVLGFGVLAACSPFAIAQDWLTIDQNDPRAASGLVGQVHSPGPRPDGGQLVTFDPEALLRFVSQAPAERFDQHLARYGARIHLPGPDGGTIECVYADSPVMAPELGARYPHMRTFLVQSVDRRFTGRFELTQRGLTAMLRGVDGIWMIDQWRSGDPSLAISYWLHDLRGVQLDWSCDTPPSDTPRDRTPAGPFSPRALQPLRTFRLAMTCTGEYGVYHSTLQGRAPNIADPLAAIVMVVARTNVVYEADTAVRFLLAENNDRVVYFNPATDPFPDTCDGNSGTDCSSPILGSLPTAVRPISGTFDVSHAMTRIFGGVAYLPGICGTNGGVSGIPRGGDIDPFAPNVVIHELGHQFSAGHTFSGRLGRCTSSNFFSSSSWEAGSGSSPMSYAGACPVGEAMPTDNVARFKDPFFHLGSIEEMRGYIPSATCRQEIPTSNNTPVFASNTTIRYSIPRQTPFKLTAQASDPDGDMLTYSWEQVDSGVQRSLTGAASADNGSGALFRIFPPVLTPSRTFPRMADVLSGAQTPGERLPTSINTTRRFRVIVRDNNPSAGGVAVSSFVELDLTSATPFQVAAPAADTVLFGGPVNVAWTVGNTNLVPISVANVTIRLSTDGGETFPTTLGTFPNNGSATVTIPSISAPGRILVEANGNVFFNVSGPLILSANCAADMDNGSAAGTRDGAVGIEDLVYYLGLYGDGDVRADVDDGSNTGTRDNAVTGDDLVYFAARYLLGC
jgi:hypothetical protein